LFACDSGPNQGRGIDIPFPDGVLKEIKPAVVYGDDPGTQLETFKCFQSMTVPNTGTRHGKTPFLPMNDPQQTCPLRKI